MTPEPLQAQLPLADPARCPRCGRDWRGVFDVAGADLAALLALPRDEFFAASMCWMGRCGERGAAR